MAKISMNLFVQAKPAESWSSEREIHQGFELTLWKYEDMKGNGYTMVCPAEVSFDIPDSFDFRNEAVMRLEERKTALQAEFQRHLNDIQTQINRFTALESAPC